MKIVKFINKVLHRFNAQLIRYPSIDIERRMKLMNYLKIDCVLDVGANVGNYSKELKQLGYKGKIISFEPLSSAFKKMKKLSSNYDNWIVYNCALGNKRDVEVINVSANSDSSSLLNMLPLHLKNAPNSNYISSEKIKIEKLDALFNQFCKPTDNIFLKIDTQGYEKKVLDGANESLKMIKAIQLEMSINVLYEDSLNYKDLTSYVENFGFKLVSIENGFSNPITGELLQFDGIFIKV